MSSRDTIQYAPDAGLLTGFVMFGATLYLPLYLYLLWTKDTSPPGSPPVSSWPSADRSGRGSREVWATTGWSTHRRRQPAAGPEP